MADDEGRLSRLPLEIIHHILSFFTTKEAIQTSILSKAWLKACSTSPTLDFNLAEMVDPEGWRYDWNERAEALQCIISVLLRYQKQKIGLDKFKLTAYESYDALTYYPLLDRCIELAVKNGLRNLDMSIDDSLRFLYWSRNPYVLPLIVLEARSLVGLSLGNCCLQHQNRIMCRSLKRLQLEEVSLSESVFENIMSNCPLIEMLKLSDCRKIRKFKVTDLQDNLKQLNVHLNPDQSIDIGATNLEFLDCGLAWKAITPPDYSAPLLIHFVAPQYKNLKRLRLYNAGISDNFFLDFKDKFPHLRYLSMERCRSLERIKISSSSLEEIQLENNNGLKKALFDVPSMVLFQYESPKSNDMILPQLSFTSSSRGWVSRIKVICNQYPNALCFSELKEFLARLNGSEIFLRLKVYGDLGSNAEKMSNTLAFPKLNGIQEVFVEGITGKILLKSVPAILDSIFGICYPPKITLRCTPLSRHVSKWLLMPRSDPGHHELWKCDLKGISQMHVSGKKSFISFNLEWEPSEVNG